MPVGELGMPTCAVASCDGPVSTRGWCHGHYFHGYLKVPVPQSLRHLTRGETPTAQHRLVMARHLGRPLYPDENVHHRHGTRTDNRLKNLELGSTAQPRRQKVSDKVTFAGDAP